MDVEQADTDIEILEEGDKELGEELSREYDEDENTSDWAYHFFIEYRNTISGYSFVAYRQANEYRASEFLWGNF